MLLSAKLAAHPASPASSLSSRHGHWIVTAGAAIAMARKSPAFGRRPAAPGRASTFVAAAAGDGPEVWVEATGVPLLEQMTKCATLQEAAMLGATQLALTAAATLIGGAILSWLDRRVNGSSIKAAEEGSQASPALLGRTLLSCLLRQGRKLLPWWSAAYAATVVCALLQVAIARRPEALSPLLGSKAAGKAAAVWARHVTQFLQDASEEVVVLLGAFTLLDFKSRVVAAIQARLARSRDGTNKDAASLVSAGGMAASVVIAAAAVLFTLANYGVNLQPLIASLGGASIVVGLAAQSALRNVSAGITLYATRPFSVGDEITLHHVEGAVVCSGVVKALHPTRTVIVGSPSDDVEGGGGGGNGKQSTFFVNNGDIVEAMVIENRSAAASSSGSGSMSD